MSRKLANGERQIDNVARIMDGWVDNHPWARGGWVPADQDWDEFTSNQPEGDAIVNPIQQVRDEVLGLCEVLLDTKSCETAVEIGVGYCGGTHYLWSLLFDRVISIDANRHLIERHICDQHPHEDQSTF